ncbi:MAG: Cys-Gln thioester bond-forming surface protein [Oscillospiraceae bacterium]|nr:Cys-Gln thioester bond-forming surface protein [Oscillospiraceae bacterium]
MRKNLKNLLKKTVSVVLSAMLLITVLPAAAHAEETTPPASPAADTSVQNTAPNTESFESSVKVEGENIEVTVTITQDAENPGNATRVTETQPEGVIAPSGAEVNYKETEEGSSRVNNDGTQTVTDVIEGSYTYEADGTETAPDVTLELITEGEEVENPAASADGNILPENLPADEETGEVILDEPVEMTGDDAIYGETGKIYDNQTVTGQPDRVVTADADATGVAITEGNYDDENLGDGYDYRFVSSNHPDGDSSIVFYYKKASSDTWDYQYAARQITIADINGTPDDKSDDVLFDTAYCIDESTNVPAKPLQSELNGTDVLYRLANLEDSDYYPETESGIMAEDHLRYIVTNGYTFTKPAEDQTEVSVAANTDSLNAVIEMMKNAVDENGQPLYPDVDFSKLTAREAANATQMAIWRYGNQEGELYDFQARHTNSSDENLAASAARINAVYEYLIKGTLSDEQAAEQNQHSTEIINEDKFIKDLSITVGQKSQAEEHKAVNTDNNSDNDVYNVDLTFTLYVEPGDKDDLVVSIVDSSGNVVRKARIAGDDSNDDANIFVKLFRSSEKPDSYTFKDLQLAENSDISFDLTLEGIQHLKEGVYIYRPMGYTADDGTVYKDGETSQTFVTKRSGTADVDVKATVNLKFDVKEANVKIEREWKYQAEYDLQVINDEDPTDPPKEDPKDNPKDDPKDEPKDDHKEDDPKEEILLGTGGGNIDTGDPSGGKMALLILVNLLSGGTALLLIRKRRQLKEN